MSDLRYPVGRFTPPDTYSEDGRRLFIRDIAELPGHVRAAVAGLSDVQLRHPYRDGGWSVAQTVHHLADSHVNAYIRFKLAATLDNPVAVAYPEAVWAELPDATSVDLTPSLAILDGIHARLATVLAGVPAETFARTYNHSVQGPVVLDRVLALYAWHGRHHVAHITGLRERMGW